MNYQIYVRKPVYAVVDNYNNYALCVEFEEPDGCTDFRQDGSWIPVRGKDTPAWLKDQIKESDEFEPDEGGVN